jgi:hypothetical protein
MSWWEPTSEDSWGGLPVVGKIVEAGPRCRIAVSGEIVATSTECRRGTRYFRSEIDDGTGVVSLHFSGRTRIPGMEVGARCYVEGTSRLEDGHLLLWNPIYRLEHGDHPWYPDR